MPLTLTRPACSPISASPGRGCLIWKPSAAGSIPLLYEDGKTTEACAHCHASHTILRIAEADSTTENTDEQVMINYSSVLKVVNLGQPESSLILRKPLSPQNRADADPAGPTGLTHAGGKLWNSTENPAYKAILNWIREATPTAEGTRKAEYTNAARGRVTIMRHALAVGLHRIVNLSQT